MPSAQARVGATPEGHKATPEGPFLLQRLGMAGGTELAGVGACIVCAVAPPCGCGRGRKASHGLLLAVCAGASYCRAGPPV
jgi:hypothetical protein